MVLGEVSGEWCKARAVAEALRGVSADVLVIADADVWVATVSHVVEAVRAGHQWGYPHRGIRRLTAAATEAVLAGADPDRITDYDEPPTRAHPGGGVVVVRREVYDETPLDPRFVGWGHEDDAWGLALHTIHGRPAKGNGRLIHLWHPPQERIDRRRGSEANLALFGRYRAALNNPARMRALLEEVA